MGTNTSIPDSEENSTTNVGSRIQYDNLKLPNNNLFRKKYYRKRNTSTKLTSTQKVATERKPGENVDNKESQNEKKLAHDTYEHTNTPTQTSVEFQRQCPICFELAYKNPKLLPCSHTFCLPCLMDHVKNKHSDETLVCPICRAKVYIPEGGVKDFQENYFVVAENSLRCDICRDNIGTVCKDCEKRVCVNCRKGHKCKKESSKRLPGLFIFGDTSDSTDNDSDSSSGISVRSDAPVPWSFMRPGRPWTKILLKEITKFTIEEDKMCLTLIPVSNKEVWILNGDSESVFVGLYDILGTLKQNIQLQTLCVGLAVEESKSLLVTFTEETVVRRFTGSDSTVIIQPSIFHPLGIAVYPDGNIVVAGFDKSNVEEVTLGRIKLFSYSGDELSTFTTGYDTIPLMVCVLGSDLIGLTYPESHFVDIRLKDGNVVGTYNGNNCEEFSPVNLCVGRLYNKPVMFISDSHSETIHVISYAAEFIGLALKSKICGSSDLGEPGGLCFDSSGKLWVSQRENNVISVYDICKFSNVME